MGIEASYSSGSAGITAACLPPSGLNETSGKILSDSVKK